MHNLYLFNPDNEMSIANGKSSYMPPANIVLMSNELAFLPAYFAGPGDHVLVPVRPDVAFMRSREVIFGMRDVTVTWKEAGEGVWNEIRPWGWSPRVHVLLEDLKCRCSEAFRQSVMFRWEEARRDLYSRRKAMECLVKIQQRLPGVDRGVIPRVCHSIEAIREASDVEGIVAKAPWSSAGKGLQFIRQGELMQKEQEILSGILRRQGYVMVEKKRERVLDFAMEFEIDRQFQVSFLGLSIFTTGPRGDYEDNRVASPSDLEKIITRYVDKTRLVAVRDEVTRALGEVYHEMYTGCLGVDMMIYRDELGQYQVQPCVEINLRYNMGILSLGLQRYLAEGTRGTFTIRFSGKPGELQAHVEEVQRAYPVELRGGKIVSGYVNLTPVFPGTRFVAELIAEVDQNV